MKLKTRHPFKWSALLLLILHLVAQGLVAYAEQKPDNRDKQLVVAFSPQSFYNVDPRDASGAARVWINNADHRLKSTTESKVIFFDTQLEMESALARNNIDILVSIAEEFIQMRDTYKLSPVLSTDYGKNFYDELLLLVHSDSTITGVEQLRGKCLRIEVGQKGTVPMKWLNTILMSKTSGSTREFFGSISEFPKASQTIMPVFFGKCDACIASRTSLETMTELNPQIGRKLRILERSPGFATGIISVRKDILNRRRDTMVEALRDINEDIKGKQVLTIFRINRLIPFRAEHLASLEKLLRGNRKSTRDRGRGN